MIEIHTTTTGIIPSVSPTQSEQSKSQWSEGSHQALKLFLCPLAWYKDQEEPKTAERRQMENQLKGNVCGNKVNQWNSQLQDATEAKILTGSKK